MPWWGWLALYGVSVWLLATACEFGRRECVRDPEFKFDKAWDFPAVAVVMLWPLVLLIVIASAFRKRFRERGRG